jgi:thiol-disulfide isomerase/thioredoxin
MKPILILVFIFLACVSEDPTSFTEKTLADVFLTENDTEISFSEILESHSGETIFIDVWATWCKDCIVGMPKLKMLESEFPDVRFVYLSLDKTIPSWKKGIKKYKLGGEHYYISSGWKGPFGDGIDLDWIPRYMVVNPEGEISVFRAIKTDDKAMMNNLKTLTANSIKE